MSQELILDRQLDAAKNMAWWLYVLHGLSLLFTLGALSFIPLILNYVQRPSTSGTFVHTHHTWQIRSFWWYVVWMCVSAVLAATIIGIPLAWLVGVCAWLWKAYRLISGMLRLNRNEAAAV
ncbi:DUF4870 family protein [Oxalobacteraceae bacterium A2-2]